MFCIFASVWLRNEDGMGKNPSLYGTGLPQYSPQHVNMVMQSAISPVLFSTPVKIMNLSSSYRDIMMTAGLKSVSMPVSRLLSCLGIKQCHWGDGSKQPGFLAWGSTAQPCLAAARVQWGKEQDGCVPTGLSSKPSAPTGLPGAGECHPLGHSGCLLTWTGAWTLHPEQLFCKPLKCQLTTLCYQPSSQRIY